jgi:hypothetical protein
MTTNLMNFDYSTTDTERWLSEGPDESEIEFYENHGWIVTPKILPDELLDDAVYGIDRYHSGERDSVISLGGGFLDWHTEHGNVLRLNDYVSLQNDQISDLVRFPLIGRIASQLCHSHLVRLFHDQLVVKPAGIADQETSIGWHTDRAYWKTCTSTKLLTGWIPMQDCTVEMGPLTVIDRSHLWENTAAMTTFVDRNMQALETKFFPQGEEILKVPLTLQRGQMSFHHCKTVHGSMPNLSNEPRAALTVHIQDADNAYIPHLNCRGHRSLHLNDLLCRKQPDGHPDYSDPDICPILWPTDLRTL